MRDRELAAWLAALGLSVACAVLVSVMLLAPPTETKTVTLPRTAGLKHLAFLDYDFGGVNGKGVNVKVSCEGWWDSATPPLDRKIGAEDGQVVYNICTATKAGPTG